ncbi:nitroreductase [Tissierella creatinini]|nr:nitroreductase [Tissierella creatinini]TJX63963.1 nitroreductase [Soehngenia saccharolytica]
MECVAMIAKESMVKRKSVRTYMDEQIDSSLMDRLQKYTDVVSSPFDTNIRYEIIDAKQGEGLGTHGFIKGVNTFICMAVQDQERTEENLGYTTEKIILYAVSLGLGTCWLVESINKDHFAKAMGLKNGEILPAVVAIGYPAEKRSIRDKAKFTITHSKDRKDWSEIFFDKDFTQPLNKENSGVYSEALEMLRIAPSGFNTQPWRVIKSHDSFHFFVERKKKKNGFDYDKLYIGIAMSHFEVALNEIGIYGRWIDENPNLSKDNKEYVISFII